MEDVLDVYHRSYDAKKPMVCLDEASKQLITAIRPDLPCRPRQIRRTDSEYKRNGTANIFMMFEPLIRQWNLLKTLQSHRSPGENVFGDGAVTHGFMVSLVSFIIVS